LCRYVCTSGDTCPPSGFDGTGFNGFAKGTNDECGFDGDGNQKTNWYNSLVVSSGSMPGPHGEYARGNALYMQGQ